MARDSLSALRDDYTSPIRDLLWGHIYLTPAMADLTASAPFKRLSRIAQLGPASGVYPGATHTRASHSIGVYHLARRLLIRLADAGALAWLSAAGVRSFLCASLLHDLGHFPYAHSLKELPLASHEALTALAILQKPLKELVARTGADPYFTAAIIDTKLETHDNSELLFYRRLLSGALDPDKLDYLNRDALCCGVPYGVQDVDFILSRLHPNLERGVDIDTKGILSVEALLFSKYLMYKAVYWHCTVRSATAMIKKTVQGALNAGLIVAEDLYGLDDAGLFLLLERLHDAEVHAPQAQSMEQLLALGSKVRNGRYFRLAAELSFDTERHQKYCDINLRPQQELTLAEELSQSLHRRINPEQIIIDKPEPFNFETGLFVSDAHCFFEHSSTVFKQELVKTLTNSLQCVRVFIAPDISDPSTLSAAIRDLL
ncbi:HD domain-containing protein [Breznakiellaceae bacterium SP9]